MITTTAQQIIRSALLQIGALSGNESPSAAEGQDGLARLNELIDDWGVQPLTARVQQRVVADLVTGQSTYTIGLTGDFNVVRPTAIDYCALLLTNTTPETEVPLSPLTEDAYQAISQKALENAQPTSWYFESTIPLAQIVVWPIPDNDTYDLVIYYAELFAQFPSLTASVLLPPSYARALRTNLAVELAPEYGKVVTPDLRLQAGDALGTLKRSNVVMTDLAVDPALTGTAHGTYNIFSDTGA